LAAAYAWRSFDSPDDPNREEELSSMQAAAEKAIALDPLLPDAYTALGTAYARNGQWARAEQNFRRALEMEATSSFAHRSLARFDLWPLGRVKEAVREMSAAEENDPLSPRVHIELALVLRAAWMRQRLNAIDCPGDNLGKGECLGRIGLAQGRTAEATLTVSARSRTKFHETTVQAKA
jgi:tetratricopeptide (TPR) repeat protein